MHPVLFQVRPLTAPQYLVGPSQGSQKLGKLKLPCSLPSNPWRKKALRLRTKDRMHTILWHSFSFQTPWSTQACFQLVWPQCDSLNLQCIGLLCHVGDSPLHLSRSAGAFSFLKSLESSICTQGRSQGDKVITSRLRAQALESQISGFKFQFLHWALTLSEPQLSH